MSKRFDISTPRKKKDGGTYWVKIGTAWQNDKGIQLVFDALPLPDSEGRCVANLFEPRDNRDQAHKDSFNRNPPAQQSGGYDDDLDGDSVPF